MGRRYEISSDAWPQLNFTRVRADARTVPLEQTPPIRSIWDDLEKPGAMLAGVLFGFGICCALFGDAVLVGIAALLGID